MKRIVEMVGIGDTGTLSGTLQISPLHTDDIGLVILGSQAGTQEQDYLQIRNSSGTALACATSAGVIHGTGTQMIGTSTHIKTQGVSIVTVTSKAVGLCATTTNTVASASYVSIPASSTAFITAFVTALCTAGAAVSSAGAYRIDAMVTSGGHAITQTTTPLTGVTMSNKEWTTSIAPAEGAGVAAGSVCLTFTGSGTTAITWGYEMTCVLMTVV